MRSYLLDMIIRLRQQEEILLYDNILHTAADEELMLQSFLEQEYRTEAAGFPYTAPPFHPEAALWAAKTVYTAAQLMLYRQNKPDNLAALLPGFTGEYTASSILSADLCLRFLPDMLIQLRVIDSADALIALLEQILLHWHYSGIACPLNPEKLDFSGAYADNCLMQLYADRIVAYRRLRLAAHPACKDLLAANMGIYASEFWNEFQLENKIHEQHR